MKQTLLVLSLCWLLTGCCGQGLRQEKRLERIYGMPMSEIMASWRTLDALEAKVGFAFPGNSVVVNSTEDMWAVYSPGLVALPLVPVGGVKSSVNLPLAETVTFVESKLLTRRIAQPQSAFRSEWETNGYTFRGTIVRSAQLDYTVIEQLRKE